MRYWVLVFLVVCLTGCGSGEDVREVPVNQKVAIEYLEHKKYDIVSYEGTSSTYVLTKEILNTLPYFMYWGVQPFDPSVYLGQEIDVEKFIVSNHPLSPDEVDAYVFIVDGIPIGGTSFPHGDVSDGGYWNLDGKTLEEVQAKPYQEWLTDWKKKYSE